MTNENTCWTEADRHMTVAELDRLAKLAIANALALAPGDPASAETMYALARKCTVRSEALKQGRVMP